MPVAAATAGGWVSVNSGSRIATRAAAFGSPQAIFDMGLRMRDQGEGLAFAARPGRRGDGDQGQHGPGGLADAPVIFHSPAVGEQEIATLGRIHAAAAAQADEEIDLLLACERDARIDHLSRGVFDDVAKACDLDTRGGQRLVLPVGRVPPPRFRGR